MLHAPRSSASHGNARTDVRCWRCCCLEAIRSGMAVCSCLRELRLALRQELLRLLVPRDLCAINGPDGPAALHTQGLGLAALVHLLDHDLGHATRAAATAAQGAGEAELLRLEVHLL